MKFLICALLLFSSVSAKAEPESFYACVDIIAIPALIAATHASRTIRENVLFNLNGYTDRRRGYQFIGYEQRLRSIVYNIDHGLSNQENFAALKAGLDRHAHDSPGAAAFVSCVRPLLNFTHPAQARSIAIDALSRIERVKRWI